MTKDTEIGRKKVCFDNNVYADLALHRIAGADNMIGKLKESVAARTLLITPSLEVFDELVPVAHLDEEQFRKRWKLMYELVDWSHSLKPANELLKDDFIGFANTGMADNPYVTRKLPYYEAIENLANMTEPPSPTKLGGLARQTHDFKGEFAGLINQAGNHWHGKNNVPATYTFAQYWSESMGPDTDESTSFPKAIVGSLAESLRVGQKCRERGLDKLLLLPSVRLPVGYWAHSWFDQVARGRKEKPSVAFDFRHCILAGAVGTFVTRDAALRTAIEEIPGHDVQVMSLPELIATLQVPE